MTFLGLAELQEQLRNLPKHLAEQAASIVTGAAKDAKNEIRYPVGETDELNKGLSIDVSQGQFGARAVLKNKSKLALIFEHGTVARHTQLGWKRGKINKPDPGNYFIPPVERNRRKMYDRLKDMLQDNGLGVIGDE